MQLSYFIPSLACSVVVYGVLAAYEVPLPAFALAGAAVITKGFICEAMGRASK